MIFLESHFNWYLHTIHLNWTTDLLAKNPILPHHFISSTEIRTTKRQSSHQRFYNVNKQGSHTVKDETEMGYQASKSRETEMALKPKLSVHSCHALPIELCCIKCQAFQH